MNVLIYPVKCWPWPDKGWVLLPGDEASDRQHQLQTVRLSLHFTSRDGLITVVLQFVVVCMCCAGTVVREDGGCCTSWQLSIAALTSWSRLCWSSFRTPVRVQGCSIKVDNPLIHQTNHKSVTTSLKVYPWLSINPLPFFDPGIAKACEQNLRRTFQYGGRIQYPNSMELKAMLVSL